MLSAFAQTVLQLCLAAVPVFRLWLKKNRLLLLVRIALFIAKMAKHLPDQLRNVLDDVVKAVNFIKANALNSRLFAELCKESDSKFVTLLLHSHVRWLSKGKMLKRVFILRQEMKDFLQGSKPELHQKLSDYCFLMC